MFRNKVSSSLSPDLITPLPQILSAFQLFGEIATIAPIRENSGFSGAQVWKIISDSQEFALRRWPDNSMSRTRLVALHGLLRHSYNAGFTQFPVPLVAKTASTVVEHQGHLWQLEPWMPGIADFHKQPSRQKLRITMQTLGRWHRLMERYVPDHSTGAWFRVHRQPPPGLQERLVTLRERSPEYAHWNLAWSGVPMKLQAPMLHEILGLILQMGVRVLPRILRVCLTPAQAHVNLHPCLRDIWHDHVLYTDDELTGLIDPNACRTDHVASDLTRLLGSLLGDAPGEWAYALDCYQSVRPMEITELALIDCYDITNVILSGLTWVERGLFNGHSLTHFPQLMTRLEAILQRLKTISLRI